jgi:competence protein ComEA
MIQDSGMEQLFDWFRQQSLAKRWQILLAGLLAVGVIGYSLSNSETDLPAEQSSVFEPLKFDSTIYVHVVGEVTKPGLYELPVGAKAQQAIEAAGGMTSDAQAASVNLARTLTDGEQLVVLSTAMSANSSGKISLNQASAADLDALPGIGPALSQRIVDYRLEIGSFQSIEELTEVSGIGPKLFAKIREQLTL